MQRVVEAIEAVIAEGMVPSASVSVWVDGRPELSFTAGRPHSERPSPAPPHLPYDLASITKALVGSLSVAALLEDRRLRLDDPVHRWFSDVDPRLTVGHLLSHSGGYSAWRPLYRLVDANAPIAERRTALFTAARRTPLLHDPGSKWVYSDLGFLVLLQVIEALVGPIDRWWHEQVLQPSGIQDLAWGWPGAAPTERCPVRGALIEGHVHDLNCEAIGGISSHAGLFGTAVAVAALADAARRAVAAPDETPLPGRSIGLLWSYFGAGSHVGGWDTATPGGSTGSRFPSDARGHLGYTGGSVWTVPSRQATVALLTNRVHPNDDRSKIRLVRPIIHDAIADSLGWS